MNEICSRNDAPIHYPFYHEWLEKEWLEKEWLEKEWLEKEWLDRKRVAEKVPRKSQ
ncbi:hypothetical protein [Marinibactrum halimedae]|uniref:Uncharacterized protein n=1 Tax=Marinibactrum halimedae TaxID=1444977 RepID=A0AA37WN26_9GAMM|nr:hypothetical protein [Marinibactrum halimedae]MCD9459789.1 hypothetical protein [Marinibactrum halimedae]GLS27018.1 hypothetical protein GCM10007877_27370 [Marinibactrum halimedae]